MGSCGTVADSLLSVLWKTASGDLLVIFRGGSNTTGIDSKGLTGPSSSSPYRVTGSGLPLKEIDNEGLRSGVRILLAALSFSWWFCCFCFLDGLGGSVFFEGVLSLAVDFLDDTGDRHLEIDFGRDSGNTGLGERLSGAGLIDTE